MKSQSKPAFLAAALGQSSSGQLHLPWRAERFSGKQFCIFMAIDTLNEFSFRQKKRLIDESVNREVLIKLI